MRLGIAGTMKHSFEEPRWSPLSAEQVRSPLISSRAGISRPRQTSRNTREDSLSQSPGVSNFSLSLSLDLRVYPLAVKNLIGPRKPGVSRLTNDNRTSAKGQIFATETSAKTPLVTPLACPISLSEPLRLSSGCQKFCKTQKAGYLVWTKR